MNTRRSFLTLIGTTALVGAALVAAPTAAGPAPKKAKVGEAAPEFALKDAAGKEYKLADYKGKIVVLQWINPECPVCKRVCSSGLANKMRAELKAIDKDFVHLAINSTHHMGAEKTAAYLKEYKIEVPGLIDQDGTVGHTYGAKTTPHLFVIDKEGVLRYDGAIDDDDQRGTKGDKAMNYVVNAVRQLAAGETVSPDTTKPYGCSVKYKDDAGKGEGSGADKKKDTGGGG